MKKALLPLFLSAVSISLPQDSFSLDCGISAAEKIPPVVDVEGKVPEYRLRRDLGTDEIRELEREKGFDNADRTLGFTSYETRSEIHFNIDFVHDAKEENEPGCAWIRQLTTRFDVTLIDIFVPVEYQPDSCPYKEIKEHEEQHVQILREAHAQFLENLKRMLGAPGALHDGSSPIQAATMDEAKAQLSDEMQRTLDDFIKDFSDTLARRQREIDTPENYAAIQSRCPEW